MKKKILCSLVALVLLFVLAVPAAASADEVVIVLDPGHGGYLPVGFPLFQEHQSQG